ncbi:MAG: helix-turn-helix domain-containing protein [Coriobacteriia bacterium]|nr:helix-turn-helix domain-containing protein [Coriobacteriia bacterium]MCL2746571.1 helix-turn-helix domain-containing protein [Coriobacteriia bacterium]MCL2870467.1 helix-turn-helix domain-containing protein [Coriobacteriia bacterium]
MKAENMMSSYTDHKKELLSNPEFRKEYDALEGEYQALRAIIDARLETGLTQKELAERSGLKQSNISRIETGQSVPNVRTLSQLAKGFGKKLYIEFR